MERVARHNHDGVNSDKVSYSSLTNSPLPIDLRHTARFAFDTAGRYVGAASGAGAVRTFDTQGMTLTSGTASNSYSYTEILGDLATLSIFDSPLTLDFVLNWSAESSGTHRAFVLFGSAGGPTTTYTEKHFGFEFIAQATVKVRGTVCDGTTRTTVNLDLAGVTLADDNIYTAVFVPRKGVTFYINGKRVGVINNIGILPQGLPTDTTVWSECKSIRDNSGTANTIIIRWLNLHVPLFGATDTKL